MNSALIRELSRWWAELNDAQFEGAMRPPSLCVDDTTRRLGGWDRSTRTLHLAQRLVDEQPWSEVIEVLRHEMAHQYVDEVLNIRGQTDHGPAFQEVCRQRSIRAAAASAVRLDPRAAAVMRKIRALLSLAESDNENEAKSAMTLAHQLMRKHNIHAAAASDTSADAYGFSQLGVPRRRTPAHEKILAGLLGRHFFVQPVWVYAYIPKADARGRVLEVCGRPENLAIAAHVHGFMLATCERLWVRHKEAHSIVGNRDRRRYLQGVMMGFQDRLDHEALRSEEAGLVWVGDAELGPWVGSRHPHLRSSRRTTIRMTNAWAAGHAAGKKVVLRRAMDTKGRGIRALLGIN